MLLSFLFFCLVAVKMKHSEKRNGRSVTEQSSVSAPSAINRNIPKKRHAKLITAIVRGRPGINNATGQIISRSRAKYVPT